LPEPGPPEKHHVRCLTVIYARLIILPREVSENIRSILLILSALAIGGCATQASLTVFSQPEGAYLTEKGTGKAYGVAPARVVYDSKAIANFKGADGCYRVKGFDARWVSGATASR